jgi:hypothetical protein
VAKSLLFPKNIFGKAFGKIPEKLSKKHSKNLVRKKVMPTAAPKETP